jgi:hypothetical protein
MTTIRGSIAHVLETWPLQLVVDSAGRRYDVRLSEDTRVTRSGAAADPGHLRPGMEVEVSGHMAGLAIVADAIMIR